MRKIIVDLNGLFSLDKKKLTRNGFGNLIFLLNEVVRFIGYFG